jgi:TetR/AcrR family transcriptional regulator, repressor of fatR-cypB operon
MPRPKLNPEESPTREAILTSALELFAERGFHGTTIPGVARKAKVADGTMYRYFASKEKLVNHLFQHWKVQFATFLTAGLDFSREPRAIFGELWRRMWRFYEDHPVVLRFLELHHHGSYLDKRSLAVEESVLTLLEAFVKENQRRGELSKRPTRVLMALVYGGFLGMLHGVIRKHIVLTAELLEQAEDAIWDAIVASPPARRS